MCERKYDKRFLTDKFVSDFIRMKYIIDAYSKPSQRV